MKKFSITHLEEARRNPSLFAKSLLNPKVNSSGFFGRAKFIRWQDAINEFHRTNDIIKAYDYLEKSFSHYSSNPKNRVDYNMYLDSLEAYYKQYQKNGYVFLKSETLKITLNDKVLISGRVPLTFMKMAGGFSVFFFSKVTQGWDCELRFPIIQDHFAKNVYGIDSENVDVGIYSIEDNRFISKTFDHVEITGASIELKQIGDQIFSLL